MLILTEQWLKDLEKNYRTTNQNADILVRTEATQPAMVEILPRSAPQNDSHTRILPHRQTAQASLNLAVILSEAKDLDHLNAELPNPTCDGRDSSSLRSSE